MGQFRKKPVVIEAICFNGSNADEIVKWAQGDWKPGGMWVRQKADDPNALAGSSFVGTWHLVIPTLEGEMDANIGDWIIKGVRGEFYPCKPEIFAATYEALEPA